MAGYARSGWPSRSRIACIRSRPNDIPKSSRLSSQSTFESIELAAVSLELLALGLHHVGRRVLHETLVAEHPLGARDLLSQPLDLGGCVPVALGRAPLDRR